MSSIERPQRPFQGHHLNLVEATARTETREFAEGTHIVSTAQPLGTLAVYLLEPESEDGLVAWNFFDEVLEEGPRLPGHAGAPGAVNRRSTYACSGSASTGWLRKPTYPSGRTR